MLFIVGVCLISTREVFEEPFLASSEIAHTVFAVDLGNYIYKLVQDFLLRKEFPLCKINFLHHAVAVSTYAVCLIFQQNTISGVIGLLFEGTMIISELICFLRLLNVDRNGRLYFCSTLLGFVLTVFLRGICPLLILVIVTLQHDPLKMDYLPLGFFFMNVVFFLMLNGWLIKSSFTSLRRRVRARRSAAWARAHADFLQEMSLNGLNNCDLRHTSPTVIIPTDDSFRLSCPVSNVNMNCSSIAQMSNIAASRRERTLPKFDAIVNHMNSHENSRTPRVQPTEV